MIVSKTPLRMSFVGGGSDIPNYYRDDIGAVVSTSIDKYMYICVNKKFDGNIRISYTKTEEVASVEQITHPLVRESLKMLNINGGIEIASMADIPSAGSGLGSSSSYTVGLLNALSVYCNAPLSKDLLAQNACDIEINKCGEPIGKQDQYAAAYGGLNLICFYPDESVLVKPITCKLHTLQKLEESTLVFFTGRTRSASKILARQSEDLRKSSNKNLMRQMVKLAFDLAHELENDSLDNFGLILDENWSLKTQMTAGISDAQIDHWYSLGKNNGALGGKLLGAGNGGFIMFYAPPEYHNQIKNSLSELNSVKFKFDKYGAQIPFFQPTE